MWNPIVPDEAGGFYVSWEDASGIGFDVYVQRIGPDGNPAPGWPANGLPICTVPGDQEMPIIASDGAGGAYVTWPDERLGVYVQHLLPNGDLAPGFPTGGKLMMNGYAAGDILADGAGGAFVLVSKRGQYEPEYELYVLHLTATGELDSTWLRHSTWLGDGQPLPITVGIGGLQDNVQWVLDGLGGLYLRWHDYRDYGTATLDVYLQHLQSNGDQVPGWPEFGLRVTDWPGLDGGGGLVSDGQGGVYIAYAQDQVTHAVHYQYDGTLAPGWPYGGWPVVPPPGRSHASIGIVSDDAGGALVGWEEIQLDGTRDGYLMKLVSDGIVATSVALASVDATAERVRLAWSTEDGAGLAFTLERRREDVVAWQQLASLYADGSGQLQYEDCDIEPGRRYAYRLTYADTQGFRATPDTWVTVPARAVFALHGAAPNPATVGNLRVRLSLAEAGVARLSMFDVAGRRVVRHELDGTTLGEQVVMLRELTVLSPGLYWLVLEQGRQRATARATILE